MSDAELMSKIADGNVEAFNQFYTKYEARIKSLTHRLVADYNSAEDAFEMTMSSVWFKAHQFKGRSQVTSWVYRIAFNASMMILRREKSNLTYIDNYEADDWEHFNKSKLYNDLFRGALTVEPVQHRELEHEEALHYLNRAIDILPFERWQRIARFKLIDELTTIEIAAILKITLPTVKSSVFRLMEHIRKSLVQMGFFHERQLRARQHRIDRHYEATRQRRTKLKSHQFTRSSAMGRRAFASHKGFY